MRNGFAISLQPITDMTKEKEGRGFRLQELINFKSILNIKKNENISSDLVLDYK